jgi:Helix-turn-helix
MGLSHAGSRSTATPFHKGPSAGNDCIPRREPQSITSGQGERWAGCGLHRTYYSGIERGVRNVSLVNIERLAKGLKTSLPHLFERL